MEENFRINFTVRFPFFLLCSVAGSVMVWTDPPPPPPPPSAICLCFDWLYKTRRLAVVWFGSSPTPLSRQQMSFFLSLPVCRQQLPGAGGGGRGVKSHDGEKAWSSLNRSILSHHAHPAGKWRADPLSAMHTKRRKTKKEEKEVANGHYVTCMIKGGCGGGGGHANTYDGKKCCFSLSMLFHSITPLSMVIH